MTARHVAEAVLLVAGCALLLLACAGSLVLRDPLERLHLLAPASLGSVLVALAALLRGPLITLGVRGVLVAVLVVCGSPVVAVATARAVRVREHGDWGLRPDEAVGDR